MDTLMEVFMGRASLPKRSRRQPRVGGDFEQLAIQIDTLLAIDAAALREKWAALFGADPPPHLGSVMMVRAIAYRLQERALGAVKPGTQPILDRVCEGGTAAVAGEISKQS